jgi:hypothetical protein
MPELERRRDFLILHRAVREGQSEKVQRQESAMAIQDQVVKLRRITCYNV